MQYRVFAVASLIGLAGHVLVNHSSAQSAVWTPESSLAIKRIATVVPSPDGAKVAFVVSEALMDGDKSEWLSHVHVANADGSGTIQLTRGDKSATFPRWSPDGRWIGFITSRSGTANVWRIGVSGGEAEAITDEKGGITLFDWAPDGSAIAFIMLDPKSDQEEKDAREKRDWRTIDENVKQKRLYTISLPSRAAGRRTARKLTSANYSVEDFDWAPDGSTIVYRHQPTPAPSHSTNSDISAIKLSDATITLLAGTRASEQNPKFSPDGTRVAFTASDDPPTAPSTRAVHVVSSTGGAPRPLGTTFDSLPGILGWTADGRNVLVTETDRTRPTVYTLAISGGSAEPISTPTAHIGAPSLNARRTHMGFVSQDFDKPAEAFIAPANAPFHPVQVSRVQPPIDAALGKTDVVSWSSFDGLSVEALLTYPVGYQKGTRVPLVVMIHGGPAGVFTNTFIGGSAAFEPYPVAAFAARGYAVLRVNPRGSSGYGRSFRYANMRDWGGGDYRDIMTGVDHVIALGIADANRLGVMGWSYGGYLTSWIVTQTNRFKAASAGAAITDLLSMTGTSDLPNLLPECFEGELWDIFDLARSRSPVLNISTATTPTLIQHGEADVRVPTLQSYEFYNALKRRGVAARLTVYPRQAHGFTEPKMALGAAKDNLDWFDRHVKGIAVTSAR